MAVFALSGILGDADIATGVSWTLLLFLGGIFGLGNVIVDTKVTDWMAGLMLPHVAGLVGSPILLLVVVLLAMLALAIPGSDGVHCHAADISAASGTPGQGGNTAVDSDRAAAAGFRAVLASLHELLDGAGR